MSVGAVNKQTGDRIPTAGMPAIDSVLSGSSTNPVQNRVVKAAMDEKADTDIVASDFSAATSYTAGEYCIYGGKFYKFKNNHSGAWAAADVDEIKIAGELSALKSGLTNLIVNQPTTITFDADGLGTFDIPTGYIPLMAYMDENWKADIYCMNGTWIIRARAWNDPIKFIKSSAHSFGVIFVKE